MTSQISFHAFDIKDISLLDDFLKCAHFYIGDDDFTPQGRNLIYSLHEEGKIVGLAEFRLGATCRIHGDRSAALITKFGLMSEEEEDVETLLLLIRKEAKRLELGAIYLDGEELPFERELGFAPCAEKGIYFEGEGEQHLKTLRVLSFDGILDSGMLHLF